MAQGRTESAIKALRLTKFYGKTPVVRDLSFDVPHGSVTAFLGPNGAGKTTTMRMILGLVHPDEGSASILGREYRQLPQPTRFVGAVLEGSRCHPWRSARDHLRILAMSADLPSTRVDEALDLVGLTAHAAQRVSRFSLGMRQRLGIATALLGDPQVLILDEPANGLDPAGIRWLRTFLRSLAEEGRAILVSSHILAELAYMADRVLIINHGTLVAESDLAQMTARATSVRVWSSAAGQLCELLQVEGIDVQWIAPDRLRAFGTTTAVIGRLAAPHGIPLLENSAESPSLEQVFFELTAGAHAHDPLAPSTPAEVGA
jgi:ABC-2 type transport system ATP-binding protein